MAVPTYEAMMRSTLEILANSGHQSFRQLAELVAGEMRISEQDRATSIDSGQAAYISRAGWAVTYLVQAGAIRRPQRGVAEITERGRALLASVVGPISNANLAQYEEFQEFRNRSRRRSTVGSAEEQTPSPEADPDSTPEEIIARTVGTVHAALTGELLDRVMELTPTAFETLVLRLLRAMKYGASGRIESTAASGDAGIDGVISQDPLRLDRIYVQAKRYDRDR